MRTVFMGTPEFAVPSLKTLIDMPLELVGVFTQPDRPAGRGNKLESPPVKRVALENSIPVYQFERIRRQEGLDALRALKPDLVVTAAFGQILSRKILQIPSLGTINVHASLLPKHRGAAPINWSIIMGEKVTGVTTMLTDEGLDTGDMLLKTEIWILPEETAGELTDRLAMEGAKLLKTTIELYTQGKIIPRKQDESEMSYEPMLDKSIGRIDWNRNADSICNLIRGINPWPGAYTSINGNVAKIHRAIPCNNTLSGMPCGSVIAASAKQGLIVSCADGSVEILELQMPGGRSMMAKAYLNGKRIAIGTILGEQHE